MCASQGLLASRFHVSSHPKFLLPRASIVHLCIHLFLWHHPLIWLSVGENPHHWMVAYVNKVSPVTWFKMVYFICSSMEANQGFPQRYCAHIFCHVKKILIDTHTKISKEITDIVVLRKKLLKFLQGVIVQSSGAAYCGVGYRHKVCKISFYCFIISEWLPLSHRLLWFWWIGS